MSTALVLGLGIGQVYVNELTNRKFRVETVDMSASLNATYTLMSDVPSHKVYDIIICCLPNFLHEEAVKTFYGRSAVMLVEKPGLETATTWEYWQYKCRLNRQYLFMIDNNRFRPQLTSLKDLVFSCASYVNINWFNLNRIPHPGSWFTTKSLSFGGVSRDLMPHLISIYYQLGGNLKYVDAHGCAQLFRLNEITSTDYGVINPNGTYDVDDLAWCYGELKGRKSTVPVRMMASWATKYSLDGTSEGLEVVVVCKDGVNATYKLGLCPEYVYGDMIDCYMSLSHSYDSTKAEYDINLHKHLEKFNHAK